MSLSLLALTLGCASTPDSAVDPDPAEDSAAPTDTADTADTGDTAGDTADTGEDTAPAPDLDGDGFSEADGDCDDSRSWVYPGAPDGCDGLDQDCDGEPIPDGACGELQDPALAAGWVIEGGEEYQTGTLVTPFGDLNADGGNEALSVNVLNASGGDPGGYAMAPVTTTPAAVRSTIHELPVVRSVFYRDSSSGLALVPDADHDGDDELVFVTKETEYFPVADVFVVAGDAAPWPAGPNDIRDLATIRWTDDDPDEWLNDAFTGGDLDGDGAGDIVAVWYWEPWGEDRGRNLYTVLRPATTAPGTHGLSAEANRFWVVDSVLREIGPDLDGDGFAELLGAGRAPDGAENTAILEGEDISTATDSDASSLMSLSTVAELNDEPAVTYILVDEHPGPSPDLDGDGLQDLPLRLRVGDPHDGPIGLALFSGGIPEGDSLPWLQSFLMPPDNPWVTSTLTPTQWVDDLDGDERPELLVKLYRTSYPDQHCLVRSSDILGGGLTQTFGVDLPVGPCVTVDTADRLYASLTDLDGDTLPEWVIGDPNYTVEDVEVGAIYILPGFDIPWDDPAKW